MPETDTSMPARFVTIVDAAKKTGVGIGQILALAEAGRIASELRRVIDLDDLRRYLDRALSREEGT